MTQQYLQNNSEFNPKAQFHLAQLGLLEQVEGKHEAEPAKSALGIALGLSAVEGGVAFLLLSPTGWAIAFIGGLFPIILLWAMAYFQADRVELPKRYDELVDQYSAEADDDESIQSQFNSEDSLEFSAEELFTLPLIPDEQEYWEQMLDRRVSWIADNNPDSSLKTLEMVNADTEIHYFQGRKHELEQERDWRMHRRLAQLQQEVEALQNAAPDVNPVGRECDVEARKQQWLEQESLRRQQACEQDLQLIAARFKTLMQQCDERIAQAQARYEEAYRRWLEANQGNLGRAA